ncbi:hypothetical protein EDD85DRAFT_795629 [Armillaria nabsnona]|nr:hypothetical protein EDD85DRAFT_795629 [Armillaria nabsnona]
MTKRAGKVIHPPKLIKSVKRSRLLQVDSAVTDFGPSGDSDDDYKDFSDDPLWSLNILGKAPSNILPVMIALDDLGSLTRIDDSWDFYHEVHALKLRIEADYYERIKASIQADIE